MTLRSAFRCPAPRRADPGLSATAKLSVKVCFRAPTQSLSELQPCGRDMEGPPLAPPRRPYGRGTARCLGRPPHRRRRRLGGRDPGGDGCGRSRHPPHLRGLPDLALRARLRGPPSPPTPRQGGVCVIPVLVHPCLWKKVLWLAPLQMRPWNGKALASLRGDRIAEELVAIAEEVLKPPPGPPGAQPAPREGGEVRLRLRSLPPLVPTPYTAHM